MSETQGSVNLEAIRKRVDAATPGPWGYNSYSGIDSDPLVMIYDNPETPVYPEDPRPGRTDGHSFFDEADNAWIAQRRAAYAADPQVAKVPAEYGDTATGRHAADAEFIAQARTDVPSLLAEVDRLNAVLDSITALSHRPGEWCKLMGVVERPDFQLPADDDDDHVCEVFEEDGTCSSCGDATTYRALAAELLASTPKEATS